jgi:hypothetical protein
MNHEQTKLTKHTTTWTYKGATISFPIIYFTIGNGAASKRQKILGLSTWNLDFYFAKL